MTKKEYDSTRRKHNPEYFKKWHQENKECYRIYDEKYQKENHRRIWSQHTLWQHRKYGYKVNISIKELLQITQTTTHCAYCGCELDWSTGRGKGYGIGSKINTPTLDRINNETELNLANVAIVCHPCNSGKHTSTLKDYVKRCRNVVAKLGDQYD